MALLITGIVLLAGCAGQSAPTGQAAAASAPASLTRTIVSTGHCSGGATYIARLVNAAKGSGVVAGVVVSHAGHRAWWGVGTTSKTVTPDGHFIAGSSDGRIRADDHGRFVLSEHMNPYGKHSYSVMASRSDGKGFCDLSIAG